MRSDSNQDVANARDGCHGIFICAKLVNIKVNVSVSIKHLTMEQECVVDLRK